jgi:hypothetical protein
LARCLKTYLKRTAEKFDAVPYKELHMIMNDQYSHFAVRDLKTIPNLPLRQAETKSEESNPAQAEAKPKRGRKSKQSAPTESQR